MSYILFCKGKRAEKPYFVADIRKKIYTIEELCYYLYHNTTLCGEELVKTINLCSPQDVDRITFRQIFLRLLKKI